MKRCAKSGIALFKEGVDDVLFLLHILLALLQAVALALDVDNSGVVQYSVEDSRGNGDVGKDLVPLGESLVRGENSGNLFVTPCNELKEEVGSLNIHRKITDFVNDEHFVRTKRLEFVR